ncbi:hypothetical protein V8G54_005079 [Vigna mungo]|uniref:ATP-dependent DNA helicase n=1 Tax=Vigna mungo TaxID=3915 RepID=A0AAQ3PDF5_VIGMU
MWKTLSYALRSKGKTMVTFASSVIASLLLPRGRITHSKIKIPVSTLEHSISNISKGSEFSNLLQMENLIIWDEVSIEYKYYFKALNQTLKDIIKDNNKCDSVLNKFFLLFFEVADMILLMQKLNHPTYDIIIR